MRKIVFGLILFSVLNTGLYFFLQDVVPSGAFIFGPPDQVDLFRAEKVLSDPELSDMDADIGEFQIVDNSLFFTLLGLQLTLICAYAPAWWLWVRPVGFFWRAANTHSVLCVGVGGVGKTTLIRRFFLDEEQTPDLTYSFKRYSTRRHVNGRLSEIILYDHVGQDVATLNREVMRLEERGVVIEQVFVVCGVFPTRRVGNIYEVISDIDPCDPAQAGIVAEQNEKLLNENILNLIFLNMKNIEKVSVLFNHIDLFAQNDDSRLAFDQQHVKNTFNYCFPNIRLTLETMQNTYRNRHRRTFDVSYHYVSALWGIELDVEHQKVKPLKIIGDKL